MDIHSFFIFSLQEPLRELFHAEFDLLLPAADGGKIRRDGVERLIALAVVGGIEVQHQADKNFQYTGAEIQPASIFPWPKP